MKSLAHSALLPRQISALRPSTHPLSIQQKVNKYIVLKKDQRGATMAEALATVSVVASIIQLVHFSTRVASRFDEFYSIAIKEAPESIRHIKNQLPLLATAGAMLKKAIETTPVADGSTTALVRAIAGCNEQVKQLDDILQKTLPEVTDSFCTKGKKAMVSLHYNHKVESIMNTLANYVGILTFYCTAASSTLQPLTEAKLCKIRQWLSAPDPSTNYQKALGLRQADTGLWFTESDAYARWKRAATTPLWLYGIPGCGKTILSSAVLQDLRLYCQDDPGKVTAYFFFDFNDAQKQDPELMVRSLLCQLSRQCIKLPASLDALYSSCGGGQQQPSIYALVDALQSITRGFSQSYIVLDALDECTQRADLIQILETMVGWKVPSLHLLVTSRRERDIESSLNDLIDGQSQICLQSAIVDKDIQRYVQQRLSDDKRLRKWEKDASMMGLIETVLMNGAKGMFRWAVCQLDELGKCVNRKMLQKALATLPPNLDQTYDRILDAIDKDYFQYARRILQWLAFSARPLSIDEVAEVIALDGNRDPAFDRDEVLEDPLEVLNICSSLVTMAIDDGSHLGGSPRQVVVLAHYSVKEYLVSDRICIGKAAKYSMRDEVCHGAIATSCLGYLLQFQQLELKSDFLEFFKLARYSAEFWTRHAMEAGEHTKETNEAAIRLCCKEEAAYINSVRLWNPDTPWVGPDLQKDLEKIPDPLYFAAHLNLRVIVKSLLDKGADINAQSGRFGNALQAASFKGYEAMVLLLLDKGADINARGGFFGNALCTALEGTHEPTVRILLERGAKVGPDVRLKGAMHHALNNAGCTPSLVRMLQQYGAPLDTIDMDNMSPLHYCVKFSHTMIAIQLIDAGVPIDSRVHRQSWPMEVSKSTSGKEKSRLPASGSVASGLTALHFAALTGNLTMTGFLLKHGADPNAVSDYGETPLHLTLRTTLFGAKYQDDWTNLYLRAERLLDFLDFEEDDVDAILAEISFKREGVLNALLLDPRTSLAVTDYKGESPLHCIQYGKPESATLVHTLVSKGADPFASNLTQQTPLHFASKSGDHASVKALLLLGAKVTLTDDKGLNALHFAAQSGNHETIIAILDTDEARAIDLITTKDKHGRNVLHHLLSTTSIKRVETVRWLLDQGAHGSELDDSGFSPLARFIESSMLLINVGICRSLLEVKGNASFIHCDGQTLGHLCARTADFGVLILNLLVEHGVDLAKRDHHGRTVLHHAAIYGSLTEQSLEFLTDIVGIQVYEEDTYGRTALQYATELAAKDRSSNTWDPERLERIRDILQEYTPIV